LASLVLQKQKDAKLAKMATRRMIMQKLRRTPDQHSKALAQANAVRSPCLSLSSSLFRPRNKAALIRMLRGYKFRGSLLYLKAVFADAV